MRYFYLLLSHEPIRDVPETPWSYAHCLSVFKLSGTCSNAHGHASTAFSHIHCVLKWSGTSSKARRNFSTALSHIIWALRLSGTNSRVSGSSSTALSHIPWVLRWSGTYSSTHEACSTAFFTHFLCFKTIRDNPQERRIFFNGFFTHFLRLTRLFFSRPQDDWISTSSFISTFFNITISDNFKTTICYFRHPFSSSDIHQSITRLGCQAIGRSSSLTFAFWAFHLW